MRCDVEIKCWIAETPSVDEVRPSHCAGCGSASRPVGGRLVVHGHGVRRRQVRGILDEDGSPGVFELIVRKYACQACRVVMTVVPRGVLHGRQYTAPSIALALFLWLAAGLADVAVRLRVCAWRIAGQSGRRGWAQLYRWGRAAASLFALPRPVGVAATARATALRVIFMLSALAPSSCTVMSTKVFAGGSAARDQVDGPPPGAEVVARPTK